MLLIVRHPLANGARGREGCSIPTSPKIQQSRENCWIVASGFGADFWEGKYGSGFCVLKGIVELKKCGVYASTLIKKWKYWPKYIKGDAIKEHFDDKDVGDCDSWKGNMDKVPFHVYAMKEPDYVMSLMLTYGMNLRNGKETSREWVDGSGTKKTRNFNILKWWVTTSCTATPLMITTIKDTHRSV